MVSQSPIEMVSEQIPSEPIFRLTVEQYHRMTASGILTPDDRVELLEGWLVAKMTKKPPHRIATHRARAALEAVVPPGWYVDAQEPIVTADSEPEPDVAVIRGRTEDYADANPGAEQVGLAVEVADVTLLRDRRMKARIYARAGIPQYWIVNLLDRSVEVHTEPTDLGESPTYLNRVVRSETEELSVVLDGVEVGRIRIGDLLPGP
jgi:Uma2 family endonuclease